MPTLHEVIALLHGWYPPATAEPWDAVGLVSGDPDQRVAKVMFAVDPTETVAHEAAQWGADLLVVHHPLFLKPVHGVARTTPKGRTLGVLLDAGCALLTAHTNADRAVSGVSEALASALGLRDLSPIEPGPHEATDKLTVYVPLTHADGVREALASAGAGHLGDYASASFSSAGQGRFLPLDGANPAIGQVGSLEVVDEERVEVTFARSLRGSVVSAMLAAHPYEEPAYDVIELAALGEVEAGSGRIGDVAHTTLGDFAQQVADSLPRTATGVRIAGDLQRPVRRVAVCGGAGDFLLDRVMATDADVYVTSDLRHHPAGEFLDKGGPALIDVAHWAAEWTWLPVVADRVRAAFEPAGDTVATKVSVTPTDPWTGHALGRPHHTEPQVDTYRSQP
ncbi:Nif3-like dinuclear metal center hexameric protein [Nocardioides sp.]|uniref:Nif3-like dinuclear metal center hexameric protein n=1 Tax=Nocardioides sp. TaxID=35761 RepID=UPI003567A158